MYTSCKRLDPNLEWILWQSRQMEVLEVGDCGFPPLAETQSSLLNVWTLLSNLIGDLSREQETAAPLEERRGTKQSWIFKDFFKCLGEDYIKIF